jgi:hypothetical protein
MQSIWKWNALLLLSLGTPALAQTSLVTNGSFEEPALASGSWNTFGTIPGWRTISGSSIEIQAFADPLDGRQFVELDSYGSSRMRQTLVTQVGREYELSVGFSPRPGVRDNRIGVFWNGQQLAVLDDDGSSRTQNAWRRFTFRVKATGTSTDLDFADLGLSDSVGGLLDDVRVVEVTASACGAQGPGRFTPAGTTGSLHLQHTATLLSDGRVLALGGYWGPPELFQPSTRAWSASAPSYSTHRLHTATLLRDGRVLIAGGDGAASSSAELYVPGTSTLQATGALLTNRREHAAATLPDGRVLVMGGTDDAGRVLASAELYDPATGTWSATGAMSRPRRAFIAAALDDGRVLVAGGLVDGGDECTGGNCLSGAELYNPATGTWSATGALATARGFHSATRLSDGSVLVSGGSLDGTPSARAERYLPASGTWVSTGDMLSPRRRHTLTPLGNGWVLAAGGYDATSGIHASAELYDPSAGSWCATGSMGQGRYEHTATALPDGRVLITAGVSNASQYTSEVYGLGGN